MGQSLWLVQLFELTVVSSIAILLSVNIQDLLVVGELDRLAQLIVHVLRSAVDVMSDLSLLVDWLEQVLMNFWLLSAKLATQLRVMLLASLQMVVLHLNVMHLILMLNVMNTDLLVLLILIMALSASLHHHWLGFLFLVGVISIDKVVEEARDTTLGLIILHFVGRLSSRLLAVPVAVVLVNGSLWSVVVSIVCIKVFLWSVWLSSLHTSDTSVVKSFNSFSLRLLLGLSVAVEGFLRLLVIK